MWVPLNLGATSDPRRPSPDGEAHGQAFAAEDIDHVLAIVAPADDADRAETSWSIGSCETKTC